MDIFNSHQKLPNIDNVNITEKVSDEFRRNLGRTVVDRPYSLLSTTD